MFAIRRSGLAHWSAGLFAASTTHSLGPILRAFNTTNVRRAMKLQRTEIQIVKGDITDEKTDAIANGLLKLRSGVAGAILKKGGFAVQEECDAFVKTYGTLSEGSVAVTCPGTLKVKYIIHAVGPKHTPGTDLPEMELKHAVINCFGVAEQLSLRSISLPAISSGVFCYPKNMCARALLEVTGQFFLANSTATLELVRFVAMDEETVEQLERAFDDVIGGYTQKVGSPTA